MLIDLHVKNLALIEEEEIHFGHGLNVLSGETGAGKSILLGALGMALGSKVSKDILRDKGQDGLVEAVFRIENEAQRRALEELDIPIYENQVIFTRRISASRSISKLNGETVPAQSLKSAGELFLDIYGQNEHQLLRKKSNHLQMLDTFARESIAEVKEQVRKLYLSYQDCRKAYENSSLEESMRLREISFLEHEIGEITAASLAIGEDEILEQAYRRMKNASRIVSALDRAHQYLSQEGAAADQIAACIHQLQAVESYDPKISDRLSSLLDIDALISDVSGELAQDLEDNAFEEEDFLKTQERLDLINELKSKYGKRIEDILDAQQQKEKKLAELVDYENYRRQLAEELEGKREAYVKRAIELSTLRKRAARDLQERMETSLLEMNFLSVSFLVHFAESEQERADGIDDLEFYISTNPGEEPRPLRQVASGGELSRIMLALKTELAAKEEGVDTLIFDEVDTGISGKTAQAVARKLSRLGRQVQIICISHLALIAAEADSHFLIEKEVKDARTVSGIRLLGEEESLEELARMIAGDAISDSVMENAREMRELAKKDKRVS